MPTTQIPRGANLDLFIKKQTSFKVAASGEFNRTMAYSYAMAEAKPYEDDPLLGQVKQNTRDMTEPGPGLSTHSGQIVVPLDFSHLRYWLELALGTPTQSGTPSDFTNLFFSGSTELPEATIERRMAKASGTLFLNDVGVMVDRMTLQASRQAGYARLALDCVGYGQNSPGATIMGDPVGMVARDPVATALGIYKKNGTELGRVLECNLVYSNNLQGREEIGDARIGGFDIGDSSLTGSIRVRLTDTTLLDEAIAETAHVGELLFRKSATRLLAWKMPYVRMERPPIPNEGPGFVDVTYNLRAEQGEDTTAEAGAMLECTLKGAVGPWD